MENKDTFYREMRKLANENLVRSGTSLDHIIFVATTGALVLASGLIQKFQNPTLLSSVILALCVVTLLASLFVHSISYQKSIQYNKLAVKELDNWYEGVRKIGAGDLVAPFDLPRPNVEIDNNGRSKLDNWAFYLMWAGLVFLAAFVVLGVINNNSHDGQQDSGFRRHEIRR